MHVLILPSWYKTPQRPLSGTFFEEQARMLKRQGLQVGILFPYFEQSFLPELRGTPEFNGEDFLDDGLPTYYMYTGNLLPRAKALNQAYFTFRLKKKFNQYVRKYGKPDLLHAHSLRYGGASAAILAQAYQIPLVITEHFSGLVRKKVELETRNLLEKVYDKAEKVIIVSKGFREDLMSRFTIDTKKMVVIPNLVSKKFYEHEFILRPKENTSSFRFFSVSNIQANKNHELQITAFTDLLEKGYNAELIIAGDGEYLSTIKKLIEEASHSEKIKLIGSLNRQEVLKEMKACDAYLLSSQYETFGVVLIEAMACGKPVIATDCGGPRDIVTSETGILVPLNDRKAYAGAMEAMVRNANEYNAEIIREICLNKYAEGVIGNQLESLYKQILNPSPSKDD